MNDELTAKAANATKWSLITEVVVKIISPLTQVVLAHILSPEAFGVVATVTMVTSFADMLSDAGFQKYLVQHEFEDNGHLYRSANVAFLTNLCISIAIWFIVIVFNEPLAEIVGNKGLGFVLIVACSSLPLTALSSIQLALFHRSFAFKELFSVRVATALVPLFITVPLALIGFDFWSLVIGTVIGNLVNVVVLTIKSNWKPTLFYSFDELKEMVSFSAWTLLEQFSIWLTSWMGTFIVGSVLTSYYLGLYKTSISMVNTGMSIIISATTPILFAELSRRQNDEDAFEAAFFRMQHKVSLFIIPIGFGIFIYRDFLTAVILGPQWSEGSLLFGLWGLSSAIVIPIGYYASEVFRSKGKPKLSFMTQVVYLFIMVPITYIAAKHTFNIFVFASAFLRLIAISIDLFVLGHFVKFPIWKMINGLLPFFVCSFMMMGVGMLLFRLDAPPLFGIAICMVAYFIFCELFTTTRVQINSLIRNFRTGV